MENHYIKKFALGALFSVFCLVAQAQDTLTVDSNNAEFGLLNDLIAGDTTDTGERAHSVYQLKRGQTYILSGAIENRFPLTIVAEEGSGPRPRLVPGIPDGGESVRPFRARDNLTLKGLYVTGMDELGALNTDQRIIRISATGVIVRIDDCHLDQDGQSCFRTDSDNISIIVTNSIISNIGRPNNTNNGRLIDDRGANLDTVIIENSTIYNISSTMINDRGGWIKYSRINQNTIAHTGQRIIDFGECQDCEFTNNLVINPGYLGTEIDTIADNEAYMVEFALLSDLAKSELPDIEQRFVFSNNNIFLDSAIIASYPQDTAAYAFADWPIGPRPLLQPPGDSLAGAAQMATNIVEIVTFENAPPVDDLITIIDQFWSDPNSEDFKSSVKPWDISGEPFSFRYQDSFESASASTTGGQLGDLKWELILSGIGGLEQSINEAQGLLGSATAGGNIGQYPQAAIDALTAAVGEAQVVLADPSNAPEVFQGETAELNQAIDDFLGSLVTSVDQDLKQNDIIVYPNPTTDYIRFSDPRSVSFEMWTISGRLVGKSEITQNARLSTAGLQNGVYILRVRQTDNSIKTVKLIKR